MINLYNKILEASILPLGDLFTGGSFMKQLRKWRKISSLPELEIESLSKDNLSKLLKYTTTNIPYYQNLVIKHSDNPYEWIKHFPIMRKKDIKDNIDGLLATDKNKLIKWSSSGSSGIQGEVYMNKEEQSTIRAMQILWWEWSGFYSGKKIIQTGITPNRSFLKRVKDILFRTTYVTAFSQSEQEIVSILKRFSNKKGVHFGGYASSINVYAEVALRNNIKDVNFDAVICWGDKVFNHYNDNVKRAFNAKIFDTYACSEGFMVGAKADLPYYYIMSPHIYIEIVDKDGRPVNDGELGYVLLTRLDSYSMPLIRYYVGDLAVKLPKSAYPPIRKFQFPLLERIIGRDTDIIRTKGGNYMIVHTFTGIFEHIPQIQQFKVIQRTLDGITIEYIPAVDFETYILNDIEDKIYSYLNERSFIIEWVKVDSIQATSSGKPQIIQSFLKNH